MRTHSGEKPFTCLQCEFSCTKAGNLKQHMLKHRGEKPFSCNQCNYTCTKATNLKNHMLTHSGEKPFICNECNYKCTVASSLKTHRFIHTGEKPFSCKWCDYTCSQAGDLRRHILTHSGEKPFSCYECNYKCTRASALNRDTHTGTPTLVKNLLTAFPPLIAHCIFHCIFNISTVKPHEFVKFVSVRLFFALYVVDPHQDFYMRIAMRISAYADHPHEPHGSATAWPTLVEVYYMHLVSPSSAFV